MGNGASPNGPSYRAHPRLYLSSRSRTSAQCPLLREDRKQYTRPEQFDSVGRFMHDVDALIAKANDLTAAARRFETAIVCSLAQGFSLLPITEALLPKRTFQDVCYLSAFGGKADIKDDLRADRQGRASQSSDERPRVLAPALPACGVAAPLSLRRLPMAIRLPLRTVGRCQMIPPQ